MKTNKIQRKIMRRVYYAFAMRVVQHPVTMKIGLLAVALVVFAEVVHVRKIVENLLSAPLGSVPQLAFNAVMRGEVLTLLAVGVMVFVALSLPRSVVLMFRPSHNLIAV